MIVCAYETVPQKSGADARRYAIEQEPGGGWITPEERTKWGLDMISEFANLLLRTMAKPTTTSFKSPAQMFKALAHPGRLLMLDALSRGERCVHELTALVGSEMPTVSRHLSVLRNAGIVDDDKRGAQVFYRLVTPCVMNFFQCVASVREKSKR